MTIERKDLPKPLTTDVDRTGALLALWGLSREEHPDLARKVAGLMDECVCLTIDTCAEAVRSVNRSIGDWLVSEIGLAAVVRADQQNETPHVEAMRDALATPAPSEEKP